MKERASVNGRAAELNEAAARAPATGPRRPRWRGYTAFVLSGGGARGALQVGALRALLEHGERADLVVGTSAGAWNGAVFAQTPTLAGVERLAAAWRTTNPASVLLGRELPSGRPPQALAGMLVFHMARRLTAGQPSLYSDSGLRQLIEQHLGRPRFEELTLPLYVIATNLTHADRVIFQRGPVVPAILASSAIPGIFPPVEIGDDVYVDGGALDNCSLETAIRAGARRLFVVDVGYDAGSGKLLRASDLVPHGGRIGRLPASLPVATILERTAQAANRYHLERALERVPLGIELHVIRLSTPAGGSSLGFGLAAEWIAQGYAATRAYLERALPRQHADAPAGGGDSLSAGARAPASSPRAVAAVPEQPAGRDPSTTPGTV